MRILLLGSNGQVGWELRRALAPLGQVLAPRRTEGADLGRPDTLPALVERLSPDVIVNAAAYTAVDQAELAPDVAWQVNAAAPSMLAAIARERALWLVHYSSDYVFDGAKAEPYTEEDSANPSNVYGVSKLAGDRAILASGCRSMIFRTSWVFGTRGSNFVKTILKLASKQQTLHVVNDQLGAPTGAELIADVTAHALRAIFAGGGGSLAGLYNLTAYGETHWQDYARLILAEADVCSAGLMAQANSVIGISTREYPMPARRPANSRLNTAKLQNVFDLHLPPWEDAVRRVVKEIIG